MAKRWRIHAHDPDRIAALERSARLPAVVAQLLICRGIDDPATARVFLEPKLTALRDPEELPGCTAAAERLHAAIAARRPICIYGDYDVDGMTGTAILYRCLRLLGSEVSYYVPHRIDEGYGLNSDAIRSISEKGAAVIVTVDCGIASTAEARLTRELGLELIVTDHHQPGAELPDAAAIVHPSLPGQGYPFAGLSGAGVALKLAWALCQQASGAKRVQPRLREFLLEAVALAALGTVADVVPLVDENRVLVHFGLGSATAKPTLGLEALMRVAQIDGNSKLGSEDVAFALAPRLNAAGRLGQPRLGVELLVTDRPDRAEELAVYINQLNETRKSLERSIQLAAGKQIKEWFDPVEDSALVLAERGWHAGVIGVVAGRLVDKYHRPVILIALDQMGVKPGVGSARSVPGFDLHAALGTCSDYLLSYGGHAAAAGLAIEPANIDSFRAAFCEAAAGEIRSEDRVAELSIDAEAPLSAFTLKTVHQIERLAPFGQDNARPLLCTTGATLAEKPRTIGSGDRHLALKLAQDGVAFRTVAFGGGDWMDDLAALDGPIDVAFRPVINRFRGRQSVELHLVDWRETGTAS